MNKLETAFFNAWNVFCDEHTNQEEHDDFNYYKENKLPVPLHTLECQFAIGIYRADFLMGNRLIIELDGHESHTTKEQRYYDHKKQRFMTKEGYIVIRFTGSEIFVDPRKCVIDALEIADVIEDKEISIYDMGWNSCRKKIEGEGCNGRYAST